ncbi:MAG: hypothetical protein D6691_05925 [Candidatus Hydrogenedentota bacterium]|nr:MAG: hypothetical protein D6691_05925 [Candidatus Hydrogenedentota bacterium]
MEPLLEKGKSSVHRVEDRRKTFAEDIRIVSVQRLGRNIYAGGTRQQPAVSDTSGFLQSVITWSCFEQIQ